MPTHNVHLIHTGSRSTRNTYTLDPDQKSLLGHDQHHKYTYILDPDQNPYRIQINKKYTYPGSRSEIHIGSRSTSRTYIYTGSRSELILDPDHIKIYMHA